MADTGLPCDRPIVIGPNTAGAASPVPTASIETLQIGISIEKNGFCPRKAVMKVWARTAGPGKARFVIEGQNGTRTGQLSATAVKNSAGVWLATYTRNITIQTDIATRYRASGDGKASAWAPLLAKIRPTGSVQHHNLRFHRRAARDRCHGCRQGRLQEA